MAKIKRALLSVSDKSGIVDFARALGEMGAELVSTGGTARKLREAGLTVRDVSELTGFPEIMDGRVKTLHPKVHGGLLNIRGNAEHEKAKEELGIADIDLVCVNLYPFEATVAKPEVKMEDAVENIDIGGPTMLRSAAKNWKYVTVVVDPADYSRVVDEMRANDGATTYELRTELARKVFAHTSRYDSAIIGYLEGVAAEGAPEFLRVAPERVQVLRYGENPHQAAAFYREPGAKGPSVGSAKKLSGKQLSYNNIIDLDAALAIVLDFDEPCASVIKHTNPCGAAVGEDLVDAFKKGYACDPVSAFGSVVGLNGRVTADLAEALAETGRFLEAVIAPGFDEEAVRILTKKPSWAKSVRLLATGEFKDAAAQWGMKSVSGGYLLQEIDRGFPELDGLKTVTRRKPSESELADLKVAWKFCKHVKSNTITLLKDGALVGVGAGQMSRVDSVVIAARKAGERSKGSVLASDAFFPFRDGVDAAAKAGATAIIQPGGSKRDDEVVAACEEHAIAMVLSGRRHFRH